MQTTINIPSPFHLQMQEWIANAVLMHLSSCTDKNKRDPHVLWKLSNAYERISSHLEELDLSQLPTIPLLPLSQNE